MDDATIHQAMGEALIARGLATPADVAADRLAIEAEKSGQPVAQAPALPGSTASLLNTSAQSAPSGNGHAEAVDPSSPESLDAAIYRAPENPGSYDFGRGPSASHVTPAREIELRRFLHSEGVPLGLGNGFGLRWRTAEPKGPMTEAQAELAYRTGVEQLSKQWGSDFSRKIDIARSEAQRMAEKMPALVEMLEVTGLQNDPWILLTVYNLAKARGRG